MNQEYTSAKTSINHLPALFNYGLKRGIWHPTHFNLDIGAGKFPQKMTSALWKRGVYNYPYDPYNLSNEINQAALNWIDVARFETVTISNVLCVIKEKDVRLDVLSLARKALQPSGKVLISIYNGNGSGQPAPTRAGWQNNQPLEWYLSEIEQYFRVTHKTKKFITAEPLT
jgi:hypothetical protein